MTTTTESRTEEQSGLHRSVDGNRLQMQMAAAGIVRANTVEITNGGAGVVFAGEGVRLERAGARTILAGGPLTMERAGAAMVLTAGDASISRGGMPNLVALGEVKLEQSGALMTLTRKASVGQGGFIGLALAPRVEVHEGGRVLAGLREIAAMGVVAAAITSLAFVLSRVLRPSVRRAP